MTVAWCGSKRDFPLKEALPLPAENHSTRSAGDIVTPQTVQIEPTTISFAATGLFHVLANRFLSLDLKMT